MYRRIPFCRVAAAFGIMVLLTGCPGEPTASTPETVEQITQTREHNGQQEALAVAKNMYMELLERGTRVRAELENLAQLHKQWSTEITTLPEGDEGRFIAADPESVLAFRAHSTTMRTISEVNMSSMATRLDTLLAPVEAAVKSGSIAGTPSAELSEGLAQLAASIAELRKPYEDGLSAVQAITRAANARGTRSDQTLKSALQALEHEEALQRAEIIETARAKAHADVSQKLAAAQEALVRANGDREEQSIRDEAAQVAAQARQEALIAKAKNPETLDRLKPFTSKSTMAFRSPGYDRFQWEPDQTEAVPHSFGALSRYGALEQTDKGIKRLHYVVMDKRSGRAVWVDAQTPADWSWIKENQALLRELGPTLVELGYLAP